MTVLAFARPVPTRPAPALRPLAPGLLYYAGAHCPFCGGRKFHVGRVTAECVWCDAALIIADHRPLAALQEV